MKILSRIALAGLLMPALANAVDQLQYTYVDAIYETGEIDVLGIDIDADGYGAGGSIAVSENIAITASVGKIDIETASLIGRDTDSKAYSIGITPHLSVGNNIDLVIPIAIEKVELRAGSLINEDETGYSIGIGVRALVSEQIELSAGILHVDVEEDDQGVGGSVRFHATQNVSAAIGAQYFGDSQSISLSGRFAF